MSESPNHFEWNDQKVTQLQSLLGRIQLGLIGLAIGLLLLDLAKPWLLVPMALLFFLSSRELRKIDNLNEQWQQSSVTLAPRSLLIEKPAQDQQQRITFRNIESVASRSRLGIEILSLTTREEGNIELPGFKESESLRQLLIAQLADHSDDSANKSAS
ncbi:hypothetical protein [Marinobacterium jannaschii]|uniref:hypothetical protein n=1 Tax=Marinobacterium jannaschii TaxID=64970 RepID=UPI00048879C3|nr:hypothetical protein [Marinobacterium jannaschii]